MGNTRFEAVVGGEEVTQEDIYSLSEKYDFGGSEEAAAVALFAILKELKTLNATLKKMEKK